MQNVQFQGPQQYVDELLGIHRKFSQLIKETFRDDSSFISALDKVLYCQKLLCTLCKALYEAWCFCSVLRGVLYFVTVSQSVSHKVTHSHSLS